MAMLRHDWHSTLELYQDTIARRRRLITPRDRKPRAPLHAEPDSRFEPAMRFNGPIRFQAPPDV